MDSYTGLDHHALNAMLNLYDANGQIQFEADRRAAREYMVESVNRDMVFFHSLEEKLEYLFDNAYYEREVWEQYTPEFVKATYKQAYAHKFRFPTFLGAFKFYTSYALKTFDGQRYLERFEDRVVACALYLARGDEKQATALVDEIVLGRFQPATPTILNAGKAQRGELVSCFLLRTEDNMESIARSINASLQLSKRGGGVALCLTNLREQGAPIKHIENQSSGVIPVMKLLEDSFSYANQLGARQGAGAVYLNAHHPDILRFLDTKRENADEKIRIKTLSIGVVIPDVTFELARSGEPMYLFSPYDVERVYGKPFSDISVTEKYAEMVDDARIRKTKINAREFFQTLAELQFESGYPYIMFEDTVNRANPIAGRVVQSNLCVTGDTRILTDSGYRNVRELYESQEDFNVVVDERARTMNLDNIGMSTVSSTRMQRTARDAEVFCLSTKEGFELRATAWHKMYVVRDGVLVKIPLAEVVPGDKVLIQNGEGAWGSVHEPERARLAAIALAGEVQNTAKIAMLEGDSEHYRLIAVYGGRTFAPENLKSAVLSPKNGVLIPDFLLNADRETQSVFYETLRSILDDVDTVHGFYDPYIPGVIQTIAANLGHAPNYATVLSVVPDGIEDVYDVTVEDGHSVVFNGLATGNCSEILQVSTPSTYTEDLSYTEVGRDISCNLGSMNIARAIDGGDLGSTVESAIRALTAVSDLSNIQSVPSIARGNDASHAIGLGQMNLHGFLGRERIHYDSPEALDFVSTYFATVAYHAIRASNLIAIERGERFEGFEDSAYASGAYFDKYVTRSWKAQTETVRALLRKYRVRVPSKNDWAALRDSVMEHGIYNAYLQAVPPTGSISYINNSTSSIHPIASQIEIRKEGKLGRVYYPAPYMTNENREFYRDAYEIGPEAIIDVYAAATEHVDQGLSLTLFFKDTATTRDVNRAQIYAWRKGIKTIYYIRIRQLALEGTDVSECVSCML